MDTLSVSDHTSIVLATMDNVFRVLGELDLLEVQAGQKPPLNALDVLQAVATLDTIDPAVRAQIRKVIAAVPELRKAAEALPEDDREAAESVMAQLRGSIGMAGVTRSLDLIEKQQQVPALAEGVRVARQILADGQDSIYDPKHPYYQIVAKDTGPAGAAGADAGGAVSGAIVGSVTPLGPIGGAITGACAASAASIVKDVVDDLTGENDVPLFEDIGDHFPV